MPACVIESPISDAKLDALGVSRETMLERIRDAVSFAAEHGITVAFFGVDSTRADPDFFRRPTRRRSKRARSEVVVVDTIGIATPEAVAELVGRTRRAGSAPMSRCTFTATTTSGSRPRPRSPPSAPARPGFRARSTAWASARGNANLLEVALALDALYGVATNLRLDRARERLPLARELSGYALEPWKPLDGETLFRRETRRGREPVPRPARDRALLVGARRGRARGRARQEERARLDPDQVRRSSDSTYPRSGGRSCSQR